MPCLRPLFTYASRNVTCAQLHKCHVPSASRKAESNHSHTVARKRVPLQTLAPNDGISISTLMSHRKAFARWLYLHLTPKARDFLRLADRTSNASLTAALWPVIRDYLHGQHSEAVNESQRLLQLANMTKPHTWYPLAAGTQQRVIYHAGPTNSGKTHSALQVCRSSHTPTRAGHTGPLVHACVPPDSPRVHAIQAPRCMHAYRPTPHACRP